jgi:hypothetical protein
LLHKHGLHHGSHHEGHRCRFYRLQNFQRQLQEELHGKSDFLGLISRLAEECGQYSQGVKSTNLAVVVDELESAYSAASMFSGKSCSKQDAVRTTAFFPLTLTMVKSSSAPSLTAF